jgi:hypothetical protein
METVFGNRHTPEEEYWSWLAVALFLLVTVDLLTTVGAIARFGFGAEANPFVASLLREPLWVVVGVNLTVVGSVAYAFRTLLRLIECTSPRLRPLFAQVVEVWLGFLVAFGLFLFANNLSALVHGASLL